ncbi:MAG: hypothetical protein ACLRS8_19180 [Parabacteroides merdae]
MAELEEFQYEWLRSLSNTRNATGTGFLNKKFIVPNGVYLSSGSASGDKFRIILDSYGGISI